MTKKDKTEKCRFILYKYGVGEDVKFEEDIKFLMEIFETHNEWELKKGVGVKSISIMKTEKNTLCFQLNRIDGTMTDISFTHCIKKPSNISFIKKACREAIREEILNFRLRNVFYGKSVCTISGEILTENNTHIDHYDLTFEELFNNWISTKDKNYLFSKINETKDNSAITCFTDNLIVEDFIKFHNNNTKLRAVSRHANLSLLKTNRLKSNISKF